MNKHDLENMIFQIEERKGLKKVQFTQKAIAEVLGYLKEFQSLISKFEDKEQPKEVRFNGFVYDCNFDDARNILQEEILKMYAENKKLKEIEKLYTQQVIDIDKLKDDLELSEKSCVEIENENEELKHNLEEKERQLKKSIVSKLVIGQDCYFILDNKIESAKIEKIIITVSKYDDECSVYYSITDCYGYALRLPQEQVFETKEIAKSKLKEAN